MIDTQVLASGPRDADIIFVGEAENGKSPFTGREGKQLTDIAKSIGISLEDCYITNTGIRDKLIEELAPFPGNVIITVGVCSLHCLTGQTNTSTWRGSPIVIADLPGKVIIPTIHPSSILHGAYMDRYLLGADLNKARQLADDPGLFAPEEKNIIINPSYEQCLDYLTTCIHNPNGFAFDIECYSGTVECIAFSHSADSAISIPIDGYNKILTKQQMCRIWEEIKFALRFPKGPIITQNGNFDTFFLKFHYGVETDLSKLADTMIAHHIMYPDMQKSLALLNSLYTFEPFYKSDGKNAKQTGDFDLYQMYNARDAMVTFDIWERISPMLANGFQKTYNETMERIPAIQAMQTNGFQIDESKMVSVQTQYKDELVAKERALDNIAQSILDAALGPELDFLTCLLFKRDVAKQDKDKELQKSYTKQISASRTSLRQWGLPKVLGKTVDEEICDFSWHLNANSDARVCQYLYDFLGLKEQKNRKTSKITVDKIALQKLARPSVAHREGCQEATMIADIRAHSKIIDTYLGMKLFPGGRFRTMFNPRGTKYGRFSANKMFFQYGCNGQNIPPKVRRMFIADNTSSISREGE